MIKTDITVKVGYTEEDIKDSVIKSLPLSRDELREIRILKRALDLKDKGDIHY